MPASATPPPGGGAGAAVRRILLVSPFQPHPAADHGGALCLGLLARELHRHGLRVGVVHHAHEGDLPAMPGVETFAVPRRRNQERSALQLLLHRLGNGWQWGVCGLPLESAKLRTRAFRRLLRRAVADFEPDAVLVEFAVMAWCLRDLERLRRGSGHPFVTVFTDHECGESVPHRFGPGQFARRRDRRLWRRHVARCYPLADLCQALNADDARALGSRLGLPVAVRPPLVEVPGHAVDPGRAGAVLLFFGDYRHHPNAETARVLARQVLPRVRAGLPAAELWLAGPRAEPCIADLQGEANVRLLGYRRDLAAVLAQARCLVAPMFSGSGVRMKSLVAMAHGLPLVTNALGLQGLEPPAAAVATGESTDELAAACLRFLLDPAAARRAGAAAREFAQERLDGSGMVREQLARIERARTLREGASAAAPAGDAPVAPAHPPRFRPGT